MVWSSTFNAEKGVLVKKKNPDFASGYIISHYHINLMYLDLYLQCTAACAPESGACRQICFLTPCETPPVPGPAFRPVCQVAVYHPKGQMKVERRDGARGPIELSSLERQFASTHVLAQVVAGKGLELTYHQPVHALRYTTAVHC